VPGSGRGTEDQGSLDLGPARHAERRPQQKLLLARWLGLSSRLLVLEELTRGVDIGTKKEIYQLIRQMAASGTIIVWWSTENAVPLEVCDRVVAFDTEGHCAGVIEKQDLSEDAHANMTGMAA
jgi:ribose transport system ATP-binding protein